MEPHVTGLQGKDSRRTLYNYCSSKVGYFDCLSSKFVFPKKEKVKSIVLSLLSRNVVILNKDTGVLLSRVNK